MKKKIIASVIGIAIGTALSVFPFGCSVDSAISTFLILNVGYGLCVYTFYDKIKN